MADTSVDTAEDRALDALVSVIQSSAGPGAAQAQALLLRRLALDGDIIPTRMPAVRNVTEAAGYLNLLDTLGQRQTMLDVLSGALGVASASARSLEQALPPLAMSPLANDRPVGDAAATAPSNVLVRADLIAGLVAARDAVHVYGAVLPLWSPPAPVPPSLATDELDAVGRRLRLLPTAALADPTTDSLLLARPVGGLPGAFAVMARPDPAAAATASLPDVEYEAVVRDAATSTAMTMPLGIAKLVPLVPALSAGGWRSLTVDALPARASDLAWAAVTAISGLVPGATRLRDELLLMHTAADVADSPFAAKLDWIWDGTAFAAPAP
ncbi:hypothetical protein ET475_14005 [Microbacterium protaetiae]|uniref:Uncharacterized protein n=1 Tax=Microbacterium protaetiae TaxID=2509458 RepID=A0A4V0YDK1_9MICO|nr:hypothetical protein [Microbacterium protaetiae]QAY60991.1 hypothetical protein ET475_14005 [Microbacterium protaetiae]